MRVGVYVDGSEPVLRGPRPVRPRHTRLALAGHPCAWPSASSRACRTGKARRIARVVYCTAVIDAASNPSGYNDQEVYLNALAAANSVDHIAYGSYVARVKYAPLAVKVRQPVPQSRARASPVADHGAGRAG